MLNHSDPEGSPLGSVTDRAPKAVDEAIDELHQSKLNHGLLSRLQHSLRCICPQAYLINCIYMEYINLYKYLM